ncbi:hypothetical protein QJS04_geneDACA001156 [Acorus gramineus]|uniref:Dirigent protein n=1 Tax=Acorus gramineus TaxID=55184 RepID=A0AAV9AF01_ACOGR|nr:hypothetical protein QJS04_geneDACA001156 [Acorus gramineus]
MAKTNSTHLFLIISSFLLLSTTAVAQTLGDDFDFDDDNHIEAMVSGKEKFTKLHFFLNDVISGKKPSAVLVAIPNGTTAGEGSPEPFGSVYVVDDPLTDRPGGNVVGNAQGMYMSAGQDLLSEVIVMDFGFTSGEYNGSSISVFSRNPLSQTNREVAVVGGRGVFRMARGFAKLKTYFFNTTTGNAIVEYTVYVLHYSVTEFRSE